ncbi:MAG TPA: DNA gyrase inhibitor YacG [Vicinamibacterales bacterium]|nr:DNA gyrase inhibitor YacG [Vicinamibacterales bacterium]
MRSEAPDCVYCRKRPVDPAWRPFCSERCKMADLGRWLREEYRLPDEPVPPVDPEHDDEAS